MVVGFSKTVAAIAALSGLIQNVQAVPTTMSPMQELAMLEGIRQGTEMYYATYPREKYEEMTRIIQSGDRAQACTDVTIIFARGTFEPSPPEFLGIMVGSPFTSGVKLALSASGKTISSLGVDYNNNVAGYLAGGDTNGGVSMAKMISAKAMECPNTKIVASGYSQGAQVAHNALASLPAPIKNRVAAAVFFGDPFKGRGVLGMSPSKIWTDCAASDPICAGVPIPLGAHLTYGSDTENMKKSIEFVVSHV